MPPPPAGRTPNPLALPDPRAEHGPYHMQRRASCHFANDRRTIRAAATGCTRVVAGIILARWGGSHASRSQSQIGGSPRPPDRLVRPGVGAVRGVAYPLALRPVGVERLAHR